MSSPQGRERMERLRTIRELAGNIIHFTHCYLNDGNFRRMDFIENEMDNIRDEVEKLRLIHDDSLDVGSKDKP